MAGVLDAIKALDPDLGADIDGRKFTWDLICVRRAAG